MNKIDYRAVGADVASHLKLKVTEDGKDDIYKITQKFSAAIVGTTPVSVLVKFAGFVGRPDLSETSDSDTRDAAYVVIFITQTADDDAADINIDMAISDFECYLNYQEQGSPIYSCNSLILEFAKASSGHKGEDPKMKGLFGWLTLTIRIMEDG